MLRDSILATLETMPELPFEEKVELRPEMRVRTVGSRKKPDAPIWVDYETIQTAQKDGQLEITCPGGIYDMARILRATPARADLRQADVFLSYAVTDGAHIERLADDLDGRGFSVWYDRGLMTGQPYRNVLRQRIETAKAVVVLWTENSIHRDWVIAEAELARKHGKLIGLRDPKLDPELIPMPFGATRHSVDFSKTSDLVDALALLGVKPRM